MKVSYLRRTKLLNKILQQRKKKWSRNCQIYLMRSMKGYLIKLSYKFEMSSAVPERCGVCGTFYLPQDHEDHMNLHADPGTLAPKTNPNDLKKIQLAKAIHQEEEHDSTDIALRSLLPDQIPQAEDERRNIGSLQNDDNHGNNAGAGAGAGSRKISQSAFRQMQNRDRLDLTSKLAATSLSKDQLNKLNIEKQVELKQIKTMVPKKEIHKYQNEPYSNKQIKDLGGCDKKIMGPREEPKNPGNQKEQGYSVINDSSRRNNSSQDESIFVPVARKTNDPRDYNQVDTKVNESKQRQKPYTEDPYEDDRVKKSRQVQEEQPRSDHNHNLHEHECPDCHGFYCRTCGATIPPQYRPFWDEDQTPEMVEFYKKRIRQERERERKQRGDCQVCQSLMRPEQEKERVKP